MAPAELQHVTAECEAVRTTLLEAMRIMDDSQLAELRRRMDALDRGEELDG